MNLAFKIALRYLFSKKSTNAINIISLVSMIGMGLGTFALIVILSVFNGFENLVLELQNSFYADIEIKIVKGKTFKPTKELLKKLEAVEGVASYCFILEENAYLKYKDKERIATVKGVDTNFYDISSLSEKVVAGKPELTYKNINYAVLGSGIDYILGTDVNRPVESIVINIPKKKNNASIMGSKMFNTGQVMPGGVFLIQSEFDNKYIIVPLKLMRKITKTKESVSSIEIKTDLNQSLKNIKNNLALELGENYTVTARYEQDKALYKAMQAERWAVFAILGLIMFIISFNIIGSLSMISMEKKRDVSILKAMGFRENNIKQVFMLQGVLGSMLGSLIGLVFGISLLLIQIFFKIVKLPSNGGFVIDSYPVNIKFSDIILSFLMVVCISIIASYYPSKKASEQPIKDLNT